MQPRITILTLGVKNLKASTSFYEEKFEWKKTTDSNENITFFRLNGILLSLYPYDKLAEDAGKIPTENGINNISMAHLVRSKEEVDQTIAKLKNKGVKIVKEPEEAFWGGYSSYVADIDENLWEIAYNPYLPLNETGEIV